VCFWRIPFAEIPTERGARAEWLYAQWMRIDDWIAAQRGEVSEPRTGGGAPRWVDGRRGAARHW
jgi:hypothetical protein